MTAAEIFDDWTGRLSQGFGVADDLRCSAMACQEAGISRTEYLAEAARRGYNKHTAARCWSYTLEV